MTFVQKLAGSLRLARPDRGMTVLTMAVALGVIACTLSILHHQDSLLVTSRYSAVFDINQAVSASMRLQLSLADFERAPDEAGRETIALRTSILQNQLSVLREGEGQDLEVLRADGTKVLATMTAESLRLDGDVATLTGAEAGRYRAVFEGTNVPFLQMLSVANVEGGDRLRREQGAFQDSIATLCGLLGCLLLIGLLHAVLLLRRSASLARLADRDPLTGLANRRVFAERLKLLEKAAHRRDRAVLLLDLDMFKAINDTMGHATGDALLVALGRRFAGISRDGTMIARLGGDEFAAIVEGQDIEARCEEVARAMRAAMAAPVLVDGRPILVGGSIGSAVARADETDGTDLLRCADLALYAAKGVGRGCHRAYDATMVARASERRDLEEDLQGAMARGELEMHLQPIVDAASREVVSSEALIRWRHPVRGLVSPAVFVPVAEEIGLIEEFGTWMLRQACLRAASWPESHRVAVNLSARQFESGMLVARVVTALMASGLSPSRLELEVTEGILLKEEHDIVGQLEALRRLGVRIALDDFGTGYTSLGYLNTFAVDKIKIDQVFVRDGQHGPRSAAIVETICALAQRLGIDTVAEGVETEEHLAFIRKAGCREAQGYLFSRPLPAAEFEAYLASRTGRRASGLRAA